MLSKKEKEENSYHPICLTVDPNPTPLRPSVPLWSKINHDSELVISGVPFPGYWKDKSKPIITSSLNIDMIEPIISMIRVQDGEGVKEVPDMSSEIKMLGHPPTEDEIKKFAIENEMKNKNLKFFWPMSPFFYVVIVETYDINSIPVRAHGEIEDGVVKLSIIEDDKEKVPVSWKAIAIIQKPEK